ncbi:hypothetical protein VCV18_000567 [Metarhizium anisopliae]
MDKVSPCAMVVVAFQLNIMFVIPQRRRAPWQLSRVRFDEDNMALQLRLINLSDSLARLPFGLPFNRVLHIGRAMNGTE